MNKPFGDTRGTTPVTFPGTRGYIGGQTDTGTGLTNLGAREYNPTTGRFLSADPLLDPADPTSLNAYDYANNNPTTGSDPTGLFADRMGYGAPRGDGTGLYQTGPVDPGDPNAGSYHAGKLSLPQCTRTDNRGGSGGGGGGGAHKPSSCSGIGCLMSGLKTANDALNDINDDIDNAIVASSVGALNGTTNALTFGHGTHLDGCLYGSDGTDGTICKIAGVYGSVSSQVGLLFIPGLGEDEIAAEILGRGAAAEDAAPLIKAGSSGGPTAGKAFPQSVRSETLLDNPDTCVFCRMKTAKPQVDHAIPRARGGDATIDNAQTACPWCNASKGPGTSR